VETVLVMKTRDECFRVNASVGATATLALARDEQQVFLTGKLCAR
jgi:hypothetical protein